MSRKNSILGLSESEKAEFLDFFILMTIKSFMLNSVEHGKSLITSGPDHSTILLRFSAALEKCNSIHFRLNALRFFDRTNFQVDVSNGCFTTTDRSQCNLEDDSVIS